MSEQYPNEPGWKAPGTSKEAAERAAGTAGNLRTQALEQLKLKPMTADEVATELGRSLLSVRPRISELHKQGLIRETGDRHRNFTGVDANVWEIVPQITD